MRYLIIGLGIFGDNLARDLTDLGHEVIGADCCQQRIDDIKDYISTVYQIDSTEEASLSVLPLRNVDVVVVAIGENFGASIRTVALLKKAGVAHIFARATDSIHESILEGFHIDRILTPEQRAAIDLTHELELGPDARTLQIDSERVVASFKAPRYFEGLAYTDFNLDREFEIVLLGASRPEHLSNVLGMDRVVLRPLEIKQDVICSNGDVITIFGRRKDISALYRRIS